MKLLLLCAGFATRLEAITHGGPKPLLEIAGRSLLDRLLDDLLGGAAAAPRRDPDECSAGEGRSGSGTPRDTAPTAGERASPSVGEGREQDGGGKGAGASPGVGDVRAGEIDEILVVTNARHFAAYEAWATTRPVDDPPRRILDDGATGNANRLGAVRDLALAVEAFRPGAPLLVAAGDNLFRFDFAEFLDDYRCRPRSLVLAMRERDLARRRRSGVARLDDEGRILEFEEKPPHPRGEWVCPPVYIFAADALAELPAFLNVAPDTDAPGNFVGWLARRGLVWAHRMAGERFDVGTPESWAAAPAWLARSHA